MLCWRTAINWPLLYVVSAGAWNNPQMWNKCPIEPRKKICGIQHPSEIRLFGLQMAIAAFWEARPSQCPQKAKPPWKQALRAFKNDLPQRVETSKREKKRWDAAKTWIQHAPLACSVYVKSRFEDQTLAGVPPETNHALNQVWAS